MNSTTGVYSKEELIEKMAEGAHYTFISFSTPPGNRRINAGVLSPWFTSPFTDGVRKFSSAEQYVMYHKALLHGDKSRAARIACARDPCIATYIGNSIENYNPEMWSFCSGDIVYRANMLKFTQSVALMKYMLSLPQNSVLVYTDPWDDAWGVTLNSSDYYIREPKNWPGENCLGFIIMRVRDNLRMQRFANTTTQKTTKEV